MKKKFLRKSGVKKKSKFWDLSYLGQILKTCKKLQIVIVSNEHFGTCFQLNVIIDKKISISKERLINQNFCAYIYINHILSYI